MVQDKFGLVVGQMGVMAGVAKRPGGWVTAGESLDGVSLNIPDTLHRPGTSRH